MSKIERLIIIIGIMLAFILTISAAIFHGKGPFPEIPTKWIWVSSWFEQRMARKRI